jgi:hypothetical protein
VKIFSKQNSICGAVAVILFAMFAASSCRPERQPARARVMEAGAREPVDMLWAVVATAADNFSLGFTYTFSPEATAMSARGLSLKWTDVPSTAVVMPETGKKQAVALKAIGVVAKLNVQSGDPSEAPSETNSMVCLSEELLVGQVATVYCRAGALDHSDSNVPAFKSPENLSNAEATVWVKYIETCKANGLAYGTAAGELTGCYCTRPDVQIPYPRTTVMNPDSFAAYFDKFKAQCSGPFDAQKGLDLGLANACGAPHKTDQKNSTCTCGNGPTGSLKFSSFKQSSTAVVDFKTALGKLCIAGATSTDVPASKGK